MNKKQRWIFLRGLTRGTIHWGSFPGIFQQLHPDAEIEFLEIPGNGRLNAEVTPVDPFELIDLLSAQSRFVKENEKINLCGISLGGMAALKWAELRPEQIESVAIINCSLSQCSYFYERLNPKQYMKILRGLFGYCAFLQEQLVLNITSNRPEQYEKYLQRFAEFAKDHPVTKMNFFRQLLLASRIKIGEIKVPLKVISSRQDRLVSYKCSLAIADQFSGQLLVHQTAGHDLPLDEPEWLAAQL